MLNNKNLGIVIVFLTFIIFTSCNTICNNKSINYLTIKYVEWNLETYIGIDCDYLCRENFSQEYYYELSTSDSSICKHVEKFIKNKITIKDTNQPNTRMRLEIRWSDNTFSTMCIGQNEIIILDGEKIKWSYDFIYTILGFITVNRY